MLEYEAVLKRPEHFEERSGLSAEDIDVFLDALATVIEPVMLRFLWRPRLKDPADEMALETAVNGHADYLVTFNVRHFGETASLFGIRAASPGEVLRKIRGVNYEEK
jgi:predicted nucleic acid-binding protein